MIHKKVLEAIANSKWNAIPLDQFMEIASIHYYEQENLNLEDDFITAPAISQMFGESIGIYCAHMWNLYGNNKPITLIEVGGGSGNLIIDFLRGVDHVTTFSKKIQKVCMLERSSRMRSLQRINSQHLLDKYNVEWGSLINEISVNKDGYSIIISNELFDALPIKQYKLDKNKIKEVMIGIQNGELIFQLSPYDVNPQIKYHPSKVEEVIEDAASARQMMSDMMDILQQSHDGLGIAIDYGYLNPDGTSTLQGMRHHEHCSILSDVGSIDITTLVSFRDLKEIISEKGGKSLVETQRDFLIKNGILERSAMLIKSGADKDRIDRQMTRLLHPNEMGNLFKVLTFWC